MIAEFTVRGQGEPRAISVFICVEENVCAVVFVVTVDRKALLSLASENGGDGEGNILSGATVGLEC